MQIRYPLEAAYELGCEAAKGFPGDHVSQLSKDPLATRLGREPTDEERAQYELGKHHERKSTIDSAYDLGCDAAHAFPGNPLMRASTTPLRDLFDRKPTDEEIALYDAGLRDERERMARR